MKKFNEFITENTELKGQRIRMIQMGNDPDPIEPGTEGEIQFVDGIGQIHVNWDNGRTLAVNTDEDKYEILESKVDNLTREEKEQAIAEFFNSQDDGSSFESETLKEWTDERIDNQYIEIYGINEGDAAGGASTTSSPGSGTAVGGGAGSGDMGSFTSAMGVSVSGGDSGTAFATNSNVSGMGAIVSPQPSKTPGDVRGGTKGSGDIGSSGGTFTKQPAGKISKQKKKKKKSKKNTKTQHTANRIDNLYVTKYSQTEKGGKIIQNWKSFKESLEDTSID